MCNTFLSNKNATKSSGIYTFLLYCYMWKVWSQRKHFSRTEVSWFSPELVFRLYSYSWFSCWVELVRVCTRNIFLIASKFIKKSEYLWGKWIWQVLPGENGEKWQMIKRLRFDIFQNVILCQFAFHCNFRLYKWKHKIPETSEWNIWIFFFHQDFNSLS